MYRMKRKWIEEHDLLDEWDEFKDHKLPLMKLIDIFVQSKGGIK